MIDLALKNITRQRTRTFLTVMGIVLGIGAVVALGSISEGLNQEVQSGLELFGGKILVTEKGSSGFLVGFSGSELTDEDVNQISDISGVKEVVPQLYDIGEIVPFSGPEWVAIGLPYDKTEFFSGENVGIEDGRELDESDVDAIVIGNDFADKYNLEVGDFFTLRDTDLEVVGVFEKSEISDIDDNFIISIDALKDLMEVYSVPVVYVVPEDLRETETLAERIEDENEDFDALSTTDIARQASQIVGQVSIFTIGIGAVAALVGGLGIMNTMIMSVLERKREIGVMKALGATRRQIMIHFLTESFLLAAIGGIMGIVAGVLGATLLGTFLGFFNFASITINLIAGGFVFAIMLGLAGGSYPSWKAASLDPVEALRYE